MCVNVRRSVLMLHFAISANSAGDCLKIAFSALDFNPEASPVTRLPVRTYFCPPPQGWFATGRMCLHLLMLWIGVLGRRDNSQPRSQSFGVLAEGDCQAGQETRSVLGD